jgi:hypothetical protein
MAVRFSDGGCEAAHQFEEKLQRQTGDTGYAPHPSPLSASGEREGPAEREGEGQQATALGRFGEENRLTGQPW